MRLIRSMIALALLCPALAWSQPTNMVVFGDSLSDNGNLATLAAGTPVGAAILSPPYDNGRITNGPVAVEVLNDLFNFAPLEAALVSGGGNYAIAGARLRGTGDAADNAIGVPAQVATYLTAMGGTVSSDTLFVLIAGGNDIRDARDATDQVGARIVRRSVGKLMKQLKLLIKAGGKYFLIGAVPDIGGIPESALLAQALGNNRPITQGTKLSNDFNDLMYKKTRKLDAKFPDVTMSRYKFSRTLDAIEAGAPDNGYRVTDRACYIVNDGVESYDPDCFSGAGLNAFVFFDLIHPTAVVHAAAAADMFAKMQAAIEGPGVTSGGSSSSGGDSSSSGGSSSSSGGDSSSSGGSSGGATGSISLMLIGDNTDGWILFDDGSRQYVIDACRVQLEGAGIASNASDWPTISALPERSVWSTCPELLTLVGDGSGSSSSGGGSSSGGSSGGGSDDEEDKPEEEGTTVVAN